MLIIYSNIIDDRYDCLFVGKEQTLKPLGCITYINLRYCKALFSGRYRKAKRSFVVETTSIAETCILCKICGTNLNSRLEST